MWLMVLWLSALSCCLGMEWVRYAAGTGQLPVSLHWCVEYLYDTPMYLSLLIVCPVCWWMTSGIILHRRDFLRVWTTRWATWCSPLPGASDIAESSGINSTERATGGNRVVLRDWCLALFLGAVSLLSSWNVGRFFENLPPAYHDEYSYLFQAKTLMKGRLSYSSSPVVPSVFDQLHVVNQGRFASRYYPGTGVWLAPWVALGNPIWGQWLAGALTAMLVFWTARELGGSGVGFLAGILTALSPGLALFSNLMLAHHPTLLGLALFLHGFARWLTRRSPIRLLEAGMGLAFAMLCRPATAAGVALPFGIWFAWWLFFDSRTQLKSRWLGAILLSLPILFGWGVMVEYNHSITGRWTQSPYQLYTDVYTPRHVFGFDNVTRGSRALGDRELPAVTRNYDAWAENLTPALALRNVENRLLASFRWTLGLLPLVGILLASLRLPGSTPSDAPREPQGVQRNLGWKLILASILSLHVVHVPYWFDGIMHWHYVFESSILWLMLAARGVAALVVYFQSRNQPWMIAWLAGLLAVSVGANFVSFAPFWETRLELGIAELRFSKKKYAEFRSQVAREVTQRPALVLIVPDPADRHMDFVTNDPSLTAPVLFGRYVEAETPLETIRNAFPERYLYLYDARTRVCRSATD